MSLYLDGKRIDNAVSHGSGGAIDTAMSDTSTNAVQNKVIKAYCDTKQTKITISTSEPTGGEDGDVWIKVS